MKSNDRHNDEFHFCGLDSTSKIQRIVNTKSKFLFLIAHQFIIVWVCCMKRNILLFTKNESLLNDSLYIHRRYRSISSDENKNLVT